MTTKKTKAPAKRGRGRPPIANPANLTMNLRVTEDARERYRAAAEAAGVPLTTWVMAQLDRAAARGARA